MRVIQFETLNRLAPILLHATRYTLHAVFLTLVVASVFGCAPSKAYIDRSAEGQIMWPGPPEKPRIMFLWAVTQLSTTTEGRRGVADFLLGNFTGDVSDPRTANVLMRPYGVFRDTRERLYVADPGAFRVTVINLTTMEVLNITEAAGEELFSPVGVVADDAGRIYISDSMLRKVFMFDEKGSYLSRLDGDFERPTCMALDRKHSSLYVSDTLGHVVYRYSIDGKRVGKIGSAGSQRGEFNFPTHLFVDQDGNLYVTDSMNFRIQVFGPDGSFQKSVGRLGDTAGDLDKPKGVAVDSEGNIYVVDSIRDTVKIFDRTGALLLYFGEKGNEAGQFWLPSGIFIDNADIIYVADTYNMRVQAFQFLKEQEKK